ncbi:MAG TPA: M3 family peptidase [Bacteroides sp.]|nr:M3 family peptidase [Bacteroides sp.]
MKRLIPVLAVSILLAAGCNQTGNDMKDSENPFFSEYSTPFQVPPFDLIELDHFLPAYEKAIEVREQEIAKIVDNAEEPNFNNTIEALDKSGRLLTKVENVFGQYQGSNTSDELDVIAEQVEPMVSAHRDDINLNPELFKRVKSVHDNKDKFGLDTEQSSLLDRVYKNFIRGGANLSEGNKTTLREINSKLAVLSLKFGKNVLNETNSFKLYIENEEDLAGLPENVIASAASAAKADGQEGKWLFTTQRPSMYPFLTYSEKRELREILHKAYYNRGDNNDDNDNKEILNEIVNLRLEKAKVLGYETHAHYILEKNMAKTPENVYNLLRPIWDAALPLAIEEVRDMQALIDKEGGDIKLENWDWWYYAEKVRMAKYDLNDEEIRPYFKLENVRDAAFQVADNLWGLTFTPLTDIPKLHPEAQAFEVKEADGSHIGVLYMDFFVRPSKRGGAWMSSFRKQYRENGEMVTPVITNVFNFAKPTGDAPALLSFDEASTIFHEFGHALHGLLSDCNYHTLSGTSVSRDFVELPSSIMENWCAEPEVMKIYGKHYETGETIPDELIAKIQKAGHFNQGFTNLEYLSAAFLDMNWHTLKEATKTDVNEFESNALDELGLIEEIMVRYRSTYFSHIFAGGYSAGYYAYKWSEVLDADAFGAFQETSLFDAETARLYRENILERGGSDDPMELYKKFRGREPSIEPLLKRDGLSKP